MTDKQNSHDVITTDIYSMVFTPHGELRESIQLPPSINLISASPLRRKVVISFETKPTTVYKLFPQQILKYDHLIERMYLTSSLLYTLHPNNFPAPISFSDQSSPYCEFERILGEHCGDSDGRFHIEVVEVNESIGLFLPMAFDWNFDNFIETKDRKVIYVDDIGENMRYAYRGIDIQRVHDHLRAVYGQKANQAIDNFTKDLERFHEIS